MNTRVVLADDHALVRAGIRALLEGIPGITVVAEAGNGRVVLERIREHSPDIVLLDIAMAELNGIEALLMIRKEFPRTRVIILSMHADEEYVLRALRGGAAGYLLKDAAPVELETALRKVMAGKTYLTPVISGPVLEAYLGRSMGLETHPAGDSLDKLTQRQREVLQLIAEGCSTKDIAIRLHLSKKTVETHRAALMDRLGIHDVAGLVRFAIRKGLVSAD